MNRKERVEYIGGTEDADRTRQIADIIAEGVLSYLRETGAVEPDGGNQARARAELSPLDTG